MSVLSGMELLRVYDAFAASAARTPQADFLYTESVTAQVYGIPAGAVSWQQAAAAVQALRGQGHTVHP